METVTLQVAEARDLALGACAHLGVASTSAQSLTDATLSAALYGSSIVGFPHFVDYLIAYRDGRINRAPSPTVASVFPAFMASDADRGIAQYGFDLAFERLVAVALSLGVVVFTQRNSFTTGELGYYVRRLAEKGLIAVATTNANAMMAIRAGGAPVYSTNPMAFAFPLGDGTSPLLIDQASSATAYVNIVKAAAEGSPIPEGWAVDENGENTRDPTRALAGALLPFGGRKGANLAMFVEMFSAGLSGGAWSLDAADFHSGERSPGVGLSIVAIRAGHPDGNMMARAQAQVERLESLGVYVPGVSRAKQTSPRRHEIQIPRSVFDEIRAFSP